MKFRVRYILISLTLFACGFALGRESVFWQIKNSWGEFFGG